MEGPLSLLQRPRCGPLLAVSFRSDMQIPLLTWAFVRLSPDHSRASSWNSCLATGLPFCLNLPRASELPSPVRCLLYIPCSANSHRGWVPTKGPGTSLLCSGPHTVGHLSALLSPPQHPGLAPNSHGPRAVELGRVVRSECTEPLCQSPGAAITKYHPLGGLNRRNLFSRGSGGWKSKFKYHRVSPCGGQSTPCPSATF